MRADPREPLLRIANLSKQFGGLLALDGVSLMVPRGATVGIIGPNGSGKTTLVNVLSGFVRADSGSVRLRDVDITDRSPEDIVGFGIARTFQTARPFHKLSAVETLIVALCSGRVRGRSRGGGFGSRAATAMDLLEEVGFERDSAVPHQTAAALPQGYLRRLELARCLALDPEVIITDELFSGLSPSEIASLLPLLEKLQVRGVSLILVEHRLRELFRVAEWIVVLHDGRKVLEGSPTEIAADSDVREMYLGAEV